MKQTDAMRTPTVRTLIQARRLGIVVLLIDHTIATIIQAIWTSMKTRTFGPITMKIATGRLTAWSYVMNIPKDTDGTVSVSCDVVESFCHEILALLAQSTDFLRLRQTWRCTRVPRWLSSKRLCAQVFRSIEARGDVLIPEKCFFTFSEPAYVSSPVAVNGKEDWSRLQYRRYTIVRDVVKTAGKSLTYRKRPGMLSKVSAELVSIRPSPPERLPNLP